MDKNLYTEAVNVLKGKFESHTLNDSDFKKYAEKASSGISETANGIKKNFLKDFYENMRAAGFTDVGPGKTKGSNGTDPIVEFKIGTMLGVSVIFGVSYKTEGDWKKIGFTKAGASSPGNAIFIIETFVKIDK